MFTMKQGIDYDFLASVQVLSTVFMINVWS